MVEERQDTVVVERDRRSPVGWIIGLLAVLILLALFFSSNGFGLFGSNAAPAGPVNVQPSGGQ